MNSEHATGMRRPRLQPTNTHNPLGNRERGCRYFAWYDAGQTQGSAPTIVRGRG